MIGGNQPLSEVVSSVDVAFDIGIVFGFIVGFALASMIVIFYYDLKYHNKLSFSHRTEIK